MLTRLLRSHQSPQVTPSDASGSSSDGSYKTADSKPVPHTFSSASLSRLSSSSHSPPPKLPSPALSNVSFDRYSLGGSLLTPPERYGKGEDPPWKPSSDDDTSLNMLSKDRRSKTMPPNSRKQSSSRRRRPGQSRRPFSQVDGDKLSRAKVMMKQPKAVHFAGAAAILPKNTMSDLAEPVTTKRWHSVSLGNPEATDAVLEDKTRKRSSTYPRRDIVTSKESSAQLISSVRSQLTCRRVSVEHLETPATITLRRASSTFGAIFDQASCKVSSSNSAMRSTSWLVII